MKTYPLYQVDAFTTQKFAGNPAGVVSHADGLSDAQMQAIARELNNSETAFLLSPSAPDHDVWVRFFTPTTEVPSCGHATIAAHYVRAIENRLPACTVRHKIGLGVLPVEILRQDEDYKIVMTQGRVEFQPPLDGGQRQAIVAALGLAETDLDGRCPVQIVSTGHAKVLVGIRDPARLHALQPDLSRLARLSREIGCNGYFVFTLSAAADDILSRGRMFAPAIGIAEDPVTGNANGPLGAYLLRHGLVQPLDERFTFRARQGEAIGRSGTVEVEVTLQDGEPMQVRVGGNAVIVFKTEIEI